MHKIYKINNLKVEGMIHCIKICNDNLFYPEQINYFNIACTFSFTNPQYYSC